MARFGREFVRAATEPAYMQGLFTAAEQMGAAPARRRAAQQEAQQKATEQGMLAGLVPGSPEYNQALAKIMEQRGELTQASTLGATATQQQVARTKAQQTEERRKALETDAIRKAEEQGRTDIASALEGADIQTLTNYLMRDISPQGEWKSLGGDSNTLFNSVTGETKTVSVGEASAVPQLKPEEVAKLAKENLIDMDSFLAFARGGFQDYSLLEASAATEDKDAPTIVSGLQTTDNTLQTIDNALDLTGEYWRIGYDVGKFSPVGAARPLRNKVDTLKANLSFDRLQKMRDESKTGGALGQVSNIELNLLGSSVAALDPGSRDFKEQLQVVRRHYEAFKASLLGQKPPSERYVEEGGNLYYLNDEGDFVDLGEM